MPDPIAGGTINIGNYRWGGHHGPQANIIAGAGAYEVGTGYANSAHTELVTDGCVTCHMAEPYGTQAGGHQMGIEYEYHGNIELNLQGCLACHPDEDALIILMEATKEDIETLLADLKSVLETQGILDENGYINEGTWSADQAGAYLNYITVLEDRSGGAHNFAYARTLLVNSIASLN